MAVERNIDIGGVEYFAPIPVAEEIDRLRDIAKPWDGRERGPVELLCNEIGFRFDKQMETAATLVAFVRVLVRQVARMRFMQDKIAAVTGKAPSVESANVLSRVMTMLDAPEDGLIVSAAAVHDYIHENTDEEAYPCDHLIDMLSSCVSAIRFGLAKPCHSRHAASAAQDIWKQVYGVCLFDEFTPKWENEWARAMLTLATPSFAADAKATHDPEDYYFKMMDTASACGRDAYANGRTIDDCTYEDRRLVSAWKSGWRNAEQQNARALDAVEQSVGQSK